MSFPLTALVIHMFYEMQITNYNNMMSGIVTGLVNNDPWLKVQINPTCPRIWRCNSNSNNGGYNTVMVMKRLPNLNG